MPQTTMQPQITVHIPKVNLRLEDVSYLRSLSGPQKIRCAHPQHKVERLKILGLVEDKEVPALPSTVAEAEAELEKIAQEMRRLLDTRDWKSMDRLSNWSYRFSTEVRRLQPHVETVLTDLGRKLLAEGEIQVKMKKAGCL